MGRRNPGPINAPSTWALDYGDGSDGSPASSSFTVTGGAHAATYQWVNYTLDNGHTITLAAGHRPSIFRCQGTLTINGAINGDGVGFTGGTSNGMTGLGPGAGMGGFPSESDGGAGAGHVANGTNGGGAGAGWGVGGNAYNGLGDVLIQTYGNYCAGSGGGCGSTAGGGVPGAGGSGGGGLIIIARSVVIGSTADISLDGNAGSNYGGAPAGGGGGGSGGLLVILADSITLPASGTVITTTGGAGGTGDPTSGGAGAVGRIYLVYTKWISGDSAARCDPDAVEINLIPTVSAG